MTQRVGVEHGPILGGLGADLRLAIRSLFWSPGFTLVAVTVLTLGVGAATSTFAIVDAIVLRPLPFDEPDRLVAIGEVHHRLIARGLSNFGYVAPPNFVHWKRALTTLESLAASTDATGFAIRDADEPQELRVLSVTASLFDVLRVRPRIGRAFTVRA